MTTLRRAALDSVGIVQLPDYIVAKDIASGKLEVLLPGWPTPRDGAWISIGPER